MSEANAAPTLGSETATSAAGAETSVEGAADTSLTGGESQSSETGQGDAPAGDGQGAGKDGAAEGGSANEGEGDKQAKEEGEPSGAPEAYAAFALPEGYVLEGDMLEGITTFAKANGLTQEQAQAVVDLGAKQAQAIVDGFAQESINQPVVAPQHWAKQWSEQTAADPDLGGAKLNDTMALAGRVFSTFATPALGAFLNETGLAHHPELVRFMHAVGKAVSEDTLVTVNGGGKGGEQVSQAKQLYPDMK